MSVRDELAAPEFWIERWEACLRRASHPRATGYAGRRVWDYLAPRYGRGEDRDEAHARQIERLVLDLKGRGFLGEGARVLDVGCGPGWTAIAFAKAGAEVVALDFSPAMLDRLREGIPSALADRIRPVEDDWERVDLGERGWEAHFDLVFASMTPAVGTPQAFLKLHRASRHGCYFRGWAGRRKDYPLGLVWERLKGEPMPPMCADIVTAFNLLNAMGLSPSVEFQEVAWESQEPVESVRRFFEELFAGQPDLPEDELSGRIADLLASLAVDGMISRRTEGRVGTLVWEVG